MRVVNSSEIKGGFRWARKILGSSALPEHRKGRYQGIVKEDYRGDNSPRRALHAI